MQDCKEIRIKKNNTQNKNKWLNQKKVKQTTEQTTFNVDEIIIILLIHNIWFGLHRSNDYTWMAHFQEGNMQ